MAIASLIISIIALMISVCVAVYVLNKPIADW